MSYLTCVHICDTKLLSTGTSLLFGSAICLSFVNLQNSNKLSAAFYLLCLWLVNNSKLLDSKPGTVY